MKCHKGIGGVEEVKNKSRGVARDLIQCTIITVNKGAKEIIKQDRKHIVAVVVTPSTYSQYVSRYFAFHLITLKHTPQSVGLLWTTDRPIAETTT
jgi:hypothetical protein